MFTQGKFYRQIFRNGEAIYLLIGETLKNGAHKALQIEDSGRRATKTTTTYLTTYQWQEVASVDIPPKLYAKLLAR